MATGGVYTTAFELLSAYTKRIPKPSDLEVRTFAADLRVALPAPRWPEDHVDYAEAYRMSVVAQLEGALLFDG